MQNDDDVGTLQRLSPRKVFAHEAHDFTAWLEENIGVLGDVLSMGLTSVEREKSAGDFSADLLAEDEHGSRVTIENQLEQTDHKHLGQVLTYLAVLDAEVAIWITADARPEHVSAVSWINENAGGGDFYLVKVEGVPPPVRASSDHSRFVREGAPLTVESKVGAFNPCKSPALSQAVSRLRSPEPRIRISPYVGSP